jgi:hypothetical protein
VQPPKVGDVIRYVYLWSHEHDAGRDEGSKDRPAAVAAVTMAGDGRSAVIVFPVTSSQPTEPGDGVEIPAATRARLGLQAERCWVLVSEANRFVWPGFDLRPVAAAGGWTSTYGTLPSPFMAQLKAAFAARSARSCPRIVPRTE